MTESQTVKQVYNSSICTRKRIILAVITLTADNPVRFDWRLALWWQIKRGNHFVLSFGRE